MAAAASPAPEAAPETQYQIVDAVMACVLQEDAIRAHPLVAWIVMRDLPAGISRIAGSAIGYRGSHAIHSAGSHASRGAGSAATWVGANGMPAGGPAREWRLGFRYTHDSIIAAAAGWKVRGMI